MAGLFKRITQEDKEDMWKRKLQSILLNPPHHSQYMEGKELANKLSNEEDKQNFLNQLENWFYGR